MKAFAVADRSLICSQYRESLDAIRRIDPQARLGWSVPKLRRDPFKNPAMAVPAERPPVT